MWQNSKTQIVRKKLKWWQNSNFDKSQVVTKPKLWHNSHCEKKKNLKILNVTKHQLWQNSRTQIMTKIKNSNYDKTQKLKLWQNLKYDKSKFVKKKNFKMFFKVITFWHLDNWWDVLCDSCDDFKPHGVGSFMLLSYHMLHTTHHASHVTHDTSHNYWYLEWLIKLFWNFFRTVIFLLFLLNLLSDSIFNP